MAGWKFWERKDVTEETYEIPAQRAVEESERSLQRTRERWSEVHRVSGSGRPVRDYSAEIEKLIRGA